MSQKAIQLIITGAGQLDRQSWRSYQPRPYRHGFLTIQRHLDDKTFTIPFYPDWFPDPWKQDEKGKTFLGAMKVAKGWKGVEKALTAYLGVPVLEACSPKVIKCLVGDDWNGPLVWG